MTPNFAPDETGSQLNNLADGLIARIVENWLTSANERSFQLPFCQVLASEGEIVLYIARHGAFEKGKDVVTRSADGVLHAYQMKGGDIKQREWNEIQPQAAALVELPVVHPAAPGIEAHRPFLVTNGRISDEAIDYINTNNLSWQMRGFAYPLVVLQKDQLVERFIKAHGSFLPKEAKDFQRLLTLVLKPGEDPLNKPEFCLFVERILNTEGANSVTHKVRAISSLILLASYALGSSIAAENHWAVFEAWTIVGAYTRSTMMEFEIPLARGKSSLDIADLGASEALDRLVQECSNRPHFVQDNWLVDGYVYGSRQIILAGLLAAWCLCKRLDGENPDQGVIRVFLDRLKKAIVWGETAAPFILISALELEQQCKQFQGENLVTEYLQVLSVANSDGQHGLADSFASIEDSIGFFFKLTDALKSDFSGFSYTLRCCIDYLARRLRRQTLARNWRGFTRISMDKSLPQVGWEWFHWNANSAIRSSSALDEPQSWEKLRTDANTIDVNGLPSMLRSSPKFFLCFLLTYPHRLTPESLFALETALSQDLS
jgi:hypothetical protein